MKTLASLIATIFIACWVVAIAILSLKNVAPVSIRFLTFQTIELPFFLVLTFSAALGMIFMALIQPLWGFNGTEQSKELEDNDFSFDE